MSIAVSVCLLLWNIVFRPGPIQGLGSGFWPDHRVARINFFLNQNDVILVKKIKVNGLQLNFWPSRYWVFSFPVFFLTQPIFNPELDWSIKPYQFLKQCFRLCNWGNILYYTSSCVSSRSWCCFWVRLFTRLRLRFN